MTQDDQDLLRILMERQDNLSREWRDLIYECGQKKVFNLLDIGIETVAEARDLLAMVSAERAFTSR